MNFKKNQRFELIIALSLVAVGFILRLLPHFPNFAPIGAIALFSGVYFSSKKLAFFVPVLAMLASDIFLGFYEWPVAVAVYGCFIISIFLGLLVKRYKKWYTALSGSLAGSVVFFLATNFAVWAVTPWYAKTAAGFFQCYLMALPFFRNTLLGDLFYVGLFFGVYEFVMLSLKFKKKKFVSVKI